jgi:hypothetical protein
MYLKQSNYKNGRTFLSINKTYRDPKTKKNENISVMKLGYLDELKKNLMIL